MQPLLEAVRESWDTDALRNVEGATATEGSCYTEEAVDLKSNQPVCRKDSPVQVNHHDIVNVMDFVTKRSVASHNERCRRIEHFNERRWQQRDVNMSILERVHE